LLNVLMSSLCPMVRPRFSLLRPFPISPPIFSARLIHRPVDGGSTHLWNVGLLQRDYSALYARRLWSNEEY